jgi:hypothetical protein
VPRAPATRLRRESADTAINGRAALVTPPRRNASGWRPRTNIPPTARLDKIRAITAKPIPAYWIIIALDRQNAVAGTFETETLWCMYYLTATTEILATAVD